MTTTPEIIVLTKKLIETMAPSVTAVGKRAGLSYETLRSWQADRREPRTKTLRKLVTVAKQQRDELDTLIRELEPRLSEEGR